MTAVDDILFSPIGGVTAATSEINWRNIPLHITYVSPVLLITNTIGWTGGAPSPGIHYVYPRQLGAAYDSALRVEIYEILQRCLNRAFAKQPIGTNAILASIPPGTDQFTEDMRWQMVAIGANPIAYIPGQQGEMLWEQFFAERSGVITPIVTGGVISPAFIDLAVNPLPPLAGP